LPDVWVSGDASEPSVGRWSRAVAQQFLTWLAVPADRPWLDVGCGTEALSEDCRAALRERVRAELPITDAGAIPLTARTWAVRSER
jgi:hypothetical protein